MGLRQRAEEEKNPSAGKYGAANFGAVFEATKSGTKSRRVAARFGEVFGRACSPQTSILK